MPPYLFVYVGAFLCFLCLVAAVFFFQRLRWHIRKRMGKSRLGFYPSSASLGNAFQALQNIAQPQVEHMLDEKLSEDAEDDESGGPEDTSATLEKQLARLRRRPRVERLTIRLPNQADQIKGK